jgi:2-C-methyl-D-erythritol 4-phosphate cytidylyltransferase / 2-C-methyl-D-erythritol 2,4-cyclodiphosphate synthase
VKTAALIVAAGKGSRAGAADLPKQYRLLQGRPVLRHSLDTFLAHEAIDNVLVVIARGDGALYNAAAPQHSRLLPAILGGETRQESVRNGLAALARARLDRVLIHDAARPFVSAELITRVIAGLDDAEAVLPGHAIVDTLKSVEGGEVMTTVPREGLFAAETPQGFRFAAIFAAHEAAAGERLEFTDDAAIAELAGIAVRTIEGEPANIKLTTAADIVAAERRLAAEAAYALGDVRVGTGYDVHPFGPGDRVMLAGVAIPHDHGLVGHSDADVALHALTDALLGALGEADIGQYFPSTDPELHGVASERFLDFAAKRVLARGGTIAHLDLAITAEAPKIAPYREAMRLRVAGICHVALDRVAVKATTSEGLGFVGRREGIAATAVATIRLPFGVAT